MQEQESQLLQISCLWCWWVRQLHSVTLSKAPATDLLQLFGILCGGGLVVVTAAAAAAVKILKVRSQQQQWFCKRSAAFHREWCHLSHWADLQCQVFTFPFYFPTFFRFDFFCKRSAAFHWRLCHLSAAEVIPGLLCSIPGFHSPFFRFHPLFHFHFLCLLFYKIFAAFNWEWYHIWATHVTPSCFAVYIPGASQHLQNNE